MIRALCLLCGGRKETVESTCPDCGHAFAESEAELARLFSSAHLSQEELEKASVRIASGERPVPKILPRDAAGDPGVSGKEFWTLLAACLLLTPLYGIVMAWGWRTARPTASRQSLITAVSVGVVVCALWGSVYLRL